MTLASTAVVLTPFLGIVSKADAAVFDLFWSGDGGYTAKGNFSFSDEFLGEVVTENELDDLILSVFDPDGSLLQAFDYDFPNPDTSGEFNFNFDSLTSAVLQSGESDTINGFDLGVDFASGEVGVGFFSGEDDIPGFPSGGTIVLSLDNSSLEGSIILDQGGILVATKSVSESTSLAGLLAIVSIGVSLWVRRLT